MTLLDFVAKYNGQYVTAPGGDGNQCVDLANLYLIEVRKQPKIWADAVAWQRATIKGMVWVPNGPSNAPPAGSLVVWGHNANAGTGAAGHIAVSLLADGMRLLSFDQNYPEGSPCHVQPHTYDGVLGWHRPI
jgi:hypothetical protein